MGHPWFVVHQNTDDERIQGEERDREKVPYSGTDGKGERGHRRVYGGRDGG